MARPQKQTVDYFPHDANASEGDTLTILQSRFGNDGYAFWFKLLEKLSSSENHVIACRNPVKWQLLLAKTLTNEEQGAAIIELLCELEAIDAQLWHERKIIWCQKLVNNIADVYKNRNRPVPERPISTIGNSISSKETAVSSTDNTQSKLKESKLKDSIPALKKEPDPLNELRGKVFEGLQERRGNKSPVPGAEAKAITWMLKQDYTPEEILSAYDVLKRDRFWVDKFLNMQSVKTQIGEIRKRGKGGPPLRHRPGQVPSEAELDQQEKERGLR